MAIHFRTEIVNQQIKGTVSDAIDSGWCCGLSAVTTRAGCQGGYFILGAGNGNGCPAEGDCPTLLVGEIPGACCYWKNENGTYVQRCGSAETSEACNALHEGFDEGLQYSFYPGQYCENDGGNVVCNGVKRVYGDDTGCNPDDATNCFDSNNLLGNCCHNQIEGKICSISTKTECGNGVWSPPKNGAVISCIHGAPCDGVYFSGPLNYPTTTTIEQVTNTTSDIEKLPQIGDYYQGGIFVGIFNPGTPINSNGGSLVYGNPSTGNPSDYRARAGVGYGRTGWILIADLENHVVDLNYTGINLFDNIPFMSSNVIPNTFVSSTYDGLYNTIQNTSELYSKITSHTSNGFTDWYLPSQDELALYFKNIKPDTKLFNGYSIPEGSYLSSTLFSLGGQREFNGAYFNYTQQATTDSYGKVNLLPVTEKARIKLFRRIYLGPEISNIVEPENCATCIAKVWDLYLKKYTQEKRFKDDLLRELKTGYTREYKPDGSYVDKPSPNSALSYERCFSDLITQAWWLLVSLGVSAKTAFFLVMDVLFGGLGSPIPQFLFEEYDVFLIRTIIRDGKQITLEDLILEDLQCKPSTFEEMTAQQKELCTRLKCQQYRLSGTVPDLETKLECQRVGQSVEDLSGYKIVNKRTGKQELWTDIFKRFTSFSKYTSARAWIQTVITRLLGLIGVGVTAATAALLGNLGSLAALASVLAGWLALIYKFYECMGIVDDTIEDIERRWNGDSRCRDSTGKCKPERGLIFKVSCSPLDCMGRRGVLLKEYRDALKTCCDSRACLGEQDQKIKAVCNNLPIDPEQQAYPDGYVPAKPEITIPRTRKVTLGDAFGEGRIIASN